MRYWAVIGLLAAAASCGTDDRDSRAAMSAAANKRVPIASNAAEDGVPKAACSRPSFDGAAGVEFPAAFEAEPRVDAWATAAEQWLRDALTELDAKVDCRCQHCRIIGVCTSVATCEKWMREAQRRRESLGGIRGMMFSAMRPASVEAGAFVHMYVRY